MKKRILTWAGAFLLVGIISAFSQIQEIRRAAGSGGGGSAPSGTVVSTGTPVNGALMIYDGTSGTNAKPAGITTGSSTNLTVPGSLGVGMQSGFTGLSVANLPTGVAAGYQTYATDALTPFGTGSRVEWDGSVWRTTPWRVTATTDVPTYMLSVLGQCLYFDSPISVCYLNMDNYGATGILPRLSSVSGTGATALGLASANTYGTYSSLQAGTTSTGFAYARGPFLAAPASSCYFFTGGNFAFSALPDGTDNYWAVAGFDTQATGSLPTTCAAFVYDKYNALGRSTPGAETNNWLCVTARSSSYTVVDSGLTPSTNAATPDRLAVLMTTTDVKFYTNGVLSKTLSTASTIPNTAIYGARIAVVKTLGSNNRLMYEGRPFLHYRLASTPSWP